MHGIEAGVGQQQGVGVGQPDIFRGRYDQPAGNEGRVFAPLDHAGQPVDGGVGVAAPYRFDEGRDDVVVHLAVLVVGGGILLQPFGDDGVVDDNLLVFAHGLRDEVDDVEQFAGIASRIAEEGVGLARLDIAIFQIGILMDSPVEQLLQVLDFERFEYIYLAARKQRTYDLERGILGCGPDERDRAIFDGSQKGVLLRFAEPVDFVDEENRAHLGEDVGLAAVEYLAYLLDPRLYGAEGEERRLQLLRYDVGQRGFAHPRRPPKNEGRDSARVNHAAQYGSRSHQVFLPDVFVQGLGPESFCQRL